MKSIDTILERLQDSQWHSLDELRGRVSLSENQVERIITLLEENEFINLDDEKTRAKIRTSGLRFLKLPLE
jgi:transcription initiation factor IIE alpha subunit